MSQVTNKMVAVLMVMVMLVISISCDCGTASASDSADASVKAKQTVSKADGCASHCPGCPDSDDSDSGHCDSCSCPCHAPLSVQPIRLTFSELVSPLAFHEPFIYLPQVYLSKFIPPQNAA
jgi:hypothetical protein